MAAYMFQRNVLLGHKVSTAFFSFFFPANNNKKICCFQATASVICKTLFLLVISTGIFYTYTHIYFLHAEKPL